MTTPLKDELEKILNENQPRLEQVKALGRWDEVIGEKLAPYTHAKSIFQGVLTVEVKEKEWQMELSFHTKAIIEKYLKRFPKLELTKINFIYNPHFQKIVVLKNKFSNESKHHYQSKQPKSKLSLEESLENLKKNWEELKKVRASQAELESKLEHAPAARTQVISKKKQTKLNEGYSVKKIHSEFLLAQDEFQPFDLY